MTTVIGIDPGLAETGLGLVRGNGFRVEGFSCGCIRTAKEQPLEARLERIYEGLTRVLKTEHPDRMVVEDIFSLKVYPKSGITLGKVAGVILLAGCRAGVPVTEIPVREAKQVLTGNGNAGKAQLERTVRAMLNQEAPIRPYHASDALALALIGLLRRRPPSNQCHMPNSRSSGK